jgi:hypothetical protein
MGLLFYRSGGGILTQARVPGPVDTRVSVIGQERPVRDSATKAASQRCTRPVADTRERWAGTIDTGGVLTMKDLPGAGVVMVARHSGSVISSRSSRCGVSPR